MNDFIKSEGLQEEEVMLRHYLNGTMSACVNIDAVSELAKFKKIAAAEPIKKAEKKKSNVLPWFIGFASGIAASLLIVLALNLSPLFETEEVYVYQANQDVATEVTFQHGQKGIDVLKTGELSLLDEVNEDTKSASAETDAKHPQMQVITVPAGKTFLLTLYDGTKVHLNANSQLSFQKPFAEDERTVMLQGEAYFEVTKDPSHPFVVQTSGMETRVFGTEFDVKNNAKGTSSVVLVNGSVEVSSNGNRKMLVPGQLAETTKDGGITVKNVDDVDVYCAWHTGDFYFEGKTLAESCRELGQWFNRDVVFKGKRHLNLRVHMRFGREDTLESTLDLLNSFGKTHFYLDNDGTIVVE